MMNRVGGAFADFETLEPRALLTTVFSPQEVYLAELVNRARANPQAESQRLGLNFSTGLTLTEIARIVPKEPLALNSALTQAARAHSLDMAARSFIDHTNPDGLSPTQRVRAAGYVGTSGENIGAGYTSVDDAYRGWLLGPDQRKNILSLHSTFDATFHYDQIGPGFALGLSGASYPNYFTTEFGSPTGSRPAWLVGVVFTDSDNNSFYGVGEGLGGVKVDVFAGNTTTGTPLTTFTTDDAGNYQLVLASGTYSVRFAQIGTNKSVIKSVSIGQENVKLDAKATELRPPAPPPDDYPNAGAWAFPVPIVINPTSADGSRTGVIGELADSDLMTFVAARAGSTTIAAKWTSGTLSLRVRVFNTAFSVIGTGSVIGRDSSVTLSLNAGDTYYVLVEAVGVVSGDEGPTGYIADVDGPPLPPPPPPPVDEHANAGQWSQASAITINTTTASGTRSGSLGTPDDSDLFSFVAARDGQATLSVLYGAGVQTLRLRVYDSVGTLLATGSPDARNSLAAATLVSGSMYFVLVDSTGTVGTGSTPTSYEVVVQGPTSNPVPTDDHADADEWDAATAVSIAPGTASGNRTGALEVEGDSDLFTFTAARSGDTAIAARFGSGAQSLRVRVYNHQRVLVGAGVLGGRDSGITLSLVAGSVYSVLVDGTGLIDASAARTSYDLTIQGPPEPPPPLPDEVLAQDNQRMASALGAGKAVVVFFNRASQLIFAERGVDGAWSTRVLSSLDGLPTLSGSPVTWTDSKDNLSYVAAKSDNGLIVLRRTVSGVWSFRNMTKQTAGSVRLVSDPSLLVDARGTVHLAGLAPDGDLIVYTQNGLSFPNGGWRYASRNITEQDVKPVGKIMPALSGRIIGSMNGAGVLQWFATDSIGRVFIYNRSGSGLSSTPWGMANITRVSGVVGLVGDLSVVQTANNSTSVSGVDADGRLWTVSRVPGQAWRSTNISALDPNAPVFRANVSSYVNPMNVGFIAVTTTQGEVRLFRVAFHQGTFRFSSAGVSSAIPNAPSFVSSARASFSIGTISIVGTNSSGHLIRFVFNSVTQLWASEDVSELLAA